MYSMHMCIHPNQHHILIHNMHYSVCATLIICLKIHEELLPLFDMSTLSFASLHRASYMLIQHSRSVSFMLLQRCVCESVTLACMKALPKYVVESVNLQVATPYA